MKSKKLQASSNQISKAELFVRNLFLLDPKMSKNFIMVSKNVSKLTMKSMKTI